MFRKLLFLVMAVSSVGVVQADTVIAKHDPHAINVDKGSVCPALTFLATIFRWTFRWHCDLLSSQK
jgi:hypothetical protein